MFRIFDQLGSIRHRPSGTASTRRPPCRPRVGALEGRVVPSFAPVGPFPVGLFPNAVAAGDFNRDGAADAVLVTAVKTGPRKKTVQRVIPL